MRLCCAVIICCAATAVRSFSAEEVAVTRAVDQSISITTPVYRASISKEGVFEVSVKDAAALQQVFPSSKDNALSINVVNRMVALRSGKARIEFTFGDETVQVLTEGFELCFQPGKDIKAVVVPGGKGGPYGKDWYGGASALVLQNGLMAAFSQPFHVGPSGDARIVPSSYCNGSKKPGDLLEFTLTLGQPAAASLLLSAVTVSPVGADLEPLRRDGNTCGGIWHFPAGRNPAFRSAQQNISPADFQIDYQLEVLDHYVAGRNVAKLDRGASIKSGAKAELDWELPALAPGFYYLSLSANKGAEKLTSTRATFVVDLPNYTHALTRPADFKEFWQRQERKLKDFPANPIVTLVSAPANADKAFELTLDMPGGRKVHGLLVIPAKPSGAPAQFGSLLERVLSEQIEKAKGADFRAGESVALTISLPADATYSDWKSANENNLLECVLSYLRAVDFLASRPEVQSGRILVSGASRSGPLAVILAALRPKLICGVSAFVHTSAGIGWTDKPYYAWGVPGGHNATDAANVRRLAEMAAYVDPVNHAPDVVCPIVFAYGIDDNLSPPQGIEAMYHLVGSKWKRISRDPGGHQHSEGFKQIDKSMRALQDAGNATGPDQERTLKDH